MRQAAIGAGLMALLAAGIIIWILRQHANAVGEYETLLKADKDIISYHVNRAGQEVARANEARINLELYKQAHPEELSRILSDFNVKEKDLRSLITAAFQSTNRGETVIHHHHFYDSTRLDSAISSDFDISDHYLTLHGDVEQKGSQAKILWQYQYQDTISVVGSERRKWLFGPRSFFVDAALSNPRAHLSSLKSYRINEFKDKRFGIGPAILWDPFSGTVHPGISIHYDLIRF